jgi:hypothetical protein
MRARRDRHGTITYCLARRDGTRVALGKDFKQACEMWAKEQCALVRLDRPTTALRLLAGFELCSLPPAEKQVAVRRNCEMQTLRSYFLERNDPRLHEINDEDGFLKWHMNDGGSGAPDAVIRLFRKVWKFAQQLELVNSNCPWRTFDLRKVRLQAEVADVVRTFASSPLKEFLEELWAVKPAASGRQGAHMDHAHVESLRAALEHAIKRAALMLSRCGRSDLLAPVYQLEIADLLALRNSPVLALCRPPGTIDLSHQRTEMLASLKARNNASDEERRLRSSLRGEKSSLTKDLGPLNGSIDILGAKQ